MKRIALFLVLAVGGIAALGLFNGFGGSGTDEPAATVAEMPAAPSETGGDEPVTTHDLPGQGGMGAARGAAVAITPFDSFNRTFSKSVTFTDPVDGKQIQIPNAPTHWVRMLKVAPLRDAAGSPGVRWQSIHIVLYQDKKFYKRANAEALRANPATGSKGLEAYDITADEGYEIKTPILPAPGQPEALERNVIHLTKNVVIHDYVHKLDVRTSDAVIDYEAESAEGKAPVEVESKSYVVRGRGFRIDGTAQRLQILENTEYEAIISKADALPMSSGGASKGMRPHRVQAKGNTVIVRHTEEKPAWTDVRMEGGVHAEMTEGQQLDADSVSLRLVDAGPEGKSRGAADGIGSSAVLERLTADGDVRYDGKDRSGALLTAQGPKLAVDYRGGVVRSMRLAGRSVVTWRGEMGMPGEHAAPGERPVSRIVTAKATESIVFAPDAERDDASLLDLVGAARVECGRAPTDATPQRIAADRITLHLRRQERSPEVTPRTTVPDAGRRKSAFDWVPTSFAATGGVILDGPRLSGAAREIKGFDLDRPVYHVTATGPDAHLEVADDPAPTTPRSNERAGPSPTSPATAHSPARKWTPTRLLARENAVGSFRVQEGEGGVSFSGDSMQYARATGAEIRAVAGKDAHLTIEGRENRDQTIDANTIWLRQGGEERVLETAGRTHTVFYVDEEAPGTTPASTGPGRRVVELRSGSRIDISGSQATKQTDATLSVTLIDGGAMSVRTDGVVTDRLTATTIEMALVETVPLAGETGFAISARRTNEPKPARPAANAKPAAPKAPGRLVIDSDTLSLAIGTESQAGSAGKLHRVRAEGNVKAVKELPPGTPEGDDPMDGRSQFEGARFDYDAKSGVGVLVGAERKYAVVTLGREPTIDRFLSPRIDVTFRDGQMSRTVFTAPVRGVFYKRPSTEPGQRAGGNLLRFLLESLGGPLTVAGRDATVEGTSVEPVRVEMTQRDAAGAAVGNPMKITTEHLSLSMAKRLGGAGSTLVATGPGTRMESGADPSKRDSAEGDTIRFEMPPGAKRGGPGAEGILRVTSSSGFVRVRQGGNTVEAADVLYDLATDRISATKLRRADLGGPK